MKILDGGTATELQRHGISVRAPWWTSGALRTEAGRAVVRRVHEGYLDAGARIITANTFRCNLRAMRRAGLDDAAAGRLVDTAVNLAKAARGGRPTLIAGAMAPVEDCYQPRLVPTDADLRREHAWLAARLVAAGVDLVLVETMNTVREARIALEQVLRAGGVAWLSFVCTADARLLSGEPVARAARAVERDGAQAVLVNCTSLTHTENALRALREVCEGEVGAYPNIEDRSGIGDWKPADRYMAPGTGAADFGALVGRWREEFAINVCGGCCGTSPDHISAICADADA